MASKCFGRPYVCIHAVATSHRVSLNFIIIVPYLETSDLKQKMIPNFPNLITPHWRLAYI